MAGLTWKTEQNTNTNSLFAFATIFHSIPVDVIKIWYAADYFGPEAAELEMQFPIEVLNTLVPSGLPPHRLVLKQGAPIVFLRNLNRRQGLMNGTRGVVVEC